MKIEDWYSAIQSYLDKKKVFEDKHGLDKRKDKENENMELKSFFASQFGLSTKNIIVKTHSNNNTNEQKDTE